MDKYKQKLIHALSDINTDGEVVRWIERNFPELRESEDERIRKDIVSHFESIKAQALYDRQEESDGIVSSCNEKIAYLEKQKEEKPTDLPPGFYFIDLDGNRYYSKEFRYGDMKMKVVEQKPVVTHGETYHVDTLGTQQVIAGKMPQKPVEWSDNFEENIRNLLHDKLTWHSEDGRMSSTVFIDDKTLKDIISGIWFYVGKEALKYPSKELNVPEWSEEDKHNLNSVINLVHATTDGAWGSCIGDGIENWLKNLPERFILQPKQEWSEEDELMLTAVIQTLERFCGRGTTGMQIDWLKSLCPSWKPSDQ